MYWPDTKTGVDVEPARKPVASALRKYFTEGGVGQAPTVPGGDWFNQITNELLNVLAAAGIDPSKVDDNQLLQAIQTVANAEGSYEALRRSYAEAGYALRPKPESFGNGGTLTGPTDVLLDESSGKAYSHSGPYPHTVEKDTSSTGPGFTDRSGVLLRNIITAMAGVLTPAPAWSDIPAYDETMLGTSVNAQAKALAERTESLKQQDAYITGRYAFVGKSLYDVLTEAERARVLANDTTFDLTAKIQSLIDEQKPFHLIPNARHYCFGMLQMKSGAKILGAGEGNNQGNGSAWVVETQILFDSRLTNIGIQLSSPDTSLWVTEWAIDGVTLRTMDKAHALIGFKLLNLTLGHKGCFNFKLNAYLDGARYGLYSDSEIWGGEFNLKIRNCYKAFYKSMNGYSTSLSGWIKVTTCFHGVDLGNVVYSALNFWFDNCGKTGDAAAMAAAPVDELPILLKTSNTIGVSGTMGVENSDAQWINARNYSSLSYSCHYFCAANKMFMKDPVRIANVPLAQQGVIYLHNSRVAISDMTSSFLVASGWPAQNVGYPTYFIVVEGADHPKVSFRNCFINLEPYTLTSTDLGFIDAPNDTNGLFSVGYSNRSSGRRNIDWETGMLQLHSNTKKASHQMFIPGPFADASLIFELGQSGGSIVQWYSANGYAPNSANAVQRLHSNITTNRSINAAGTVNTSGADYAEYMVKADGCGEIAKGDVCGVNADGKLTHRFDDAVSFVIKSTNPSFVGGDSWFPEGAPIRPSDESDEAELATYQAELEAYNVALEETRQRVDRIAFSGQVPCNIHGATAGDYIVPVRTEAGAIGMVAVSSPTFDQYREAVGKVWATMPDGRALVAVKVG